MSPDIVCFAVIRRGRPGAVTSRDMKAPNAPYCAASRSLLVRAMALRKLAAELRSNQAAIHTLVLGKDWCVRSAHQYAWARSIRSLLKQ
jgi:hypothetical protein